jgi:hypothetical protein
MLGANNYIAFMTVVGFFVGTSFGVLKADDADMMLFWPLAITALFYILSVAVASYFIGTTEVKKNVYLNTEYFENRYDALSNGLIVREQDLKESIDFRVRVESEEQEEAHLRVKKAKKQAELGNF